eukprot:TRINITY_DN10686_c0_g1_i6.p1 TRINITY_DN10686_c0_g1~~TRINITY_DN10686_c0_g1_i6.p1  ORF type:complete len:368 (+),score=75.48 TRINITY_DN10686_c0_g1_i6:71-1174(+)
MASPPPLSELRSCADFEAAARRCLPEASWEYISGGEADTIVRNESDFASFLIRPRILVDVSEIDTRCSLFGSPCASPFYLSSVAKGGLVERVEGERAFVRAAAKAGTTYLVPNVSSRPLKDIWTAAAVSQRLPYQAYLLTDEEESFERLKEAIQLGASAVVVTVDANAPRGESFRRSTQASTGVMPSPLLSWSRLAEITDLLPPGMPLYLKGIQTGEDALKAVQLGVKGIIVSNHGGRACADAWSALSALEDVSQTLREHDALDTIEVLFDSGVRSGRDALKALCLGAQGIGLGRPYYWASACYGEEGIVALLRLLAQELHFAMAQAGAPTFSALTPSLLCRLHPQLVAAPLLRTRQHQEALRKAKL